MTPERWRRIREIFDQALDEPAERRVAVVKDASSNDPQLAEEVLRLLRAEEISGGFLEESAGNLHSFLQLEAQGPALLPGAVLCRRFEVRQFLAAGGMGEVYEAWDAELNQAVALKTILPRISENPAILERFKREVRHAREVSHPNICRVHELFCDETNGRRVWFLSMELLQGPTLQERIRNQEGLLATEAQALAEQMLAGLEAAHERGLVHRDFKSNNVMLVQQEGAGVRAVITDFGLAIGNAPHETAGEMAGTGTPGYMAPEQARGDATGPLADQYAFGVVLFEMMTGSLPRRLDTARLEGKGKGYPARWLSVIRRCTRTEAKDRFPDMEAVSAALVPGGWRKRVAWAAALVLLLGAGWTAAMPKHASIQPARCIICDTAQLTPDTDKSESPSLSTDGRAVAYSSDRAETGNLEIFVQALPSGKLTRVTNDHARDTTPSLSPDGRLVAFRSERNGGGIYVAQTEKPGEARLLVKGGQNPKISPDGKTVLYWTGDPDSQVPSGKVFQLSLSGGEPKQLALQLADARYPVWNTDGRHVLVTGCADASQLLPDCFDWWVGGIDGGAVTPAHAYAKLRTAGFLPARFGSLAWKGDQVVFSAIGDGRRLNLASVPLRVSDAAVTGPPRWLLSSDGGDVDPSIVRGQRIAFTRTSGALHIWRMRGVTGRRRPALEKVTTDTDVDGSPFIAEGGKHLVFARGRTLKRTIMLRDTVTGQETVIVEQGTPVQSPILDSTGRWVAYQQTEKDGISAIYAGELGGPMRRMCQNCTEPAGWFDGNRLFFFRDGAHAVSAMNPRTGERRMVLSDANASLNDVSWSPENDTLGLVKLKNGQRSVISVHLDPKTAETKSSTVMLGASRDAPMHPRWLMGGRAIVYVSKQDGFLCVYRRNLNGKTGRLGEPVALAHFHNQRASIDDVVPRAFNLSVDGDTLYLNLGEQNSTIEVGQIHDFR